MQRQTWGGQDRLSSLSLFLFMLPLALSLSEWFCAMKEGGKKGEMPFREGGPLGLDLSGST